jgi:hypothetical protein
MTPSPERNVASGMLNKKSTNLNSVERTTEKYTGFYDTGKNVRTTKSLNTNNRNDENENENDTDDEFEIGILNLSNHDINDDDEVLQGVSYLTPPSKSPTHINTKNTPKNSIKNTSNGAKNGTKNSTKIPNKTLTPKGSGFAENKSTVNVQYKQNYMSLKTVKTPVKRFLTEKREVSDRKEKLSDGKSDGKNGITCVFMDGVRSDEMAEMTAQIRALTSELKYFEELTGKRCIFETKVRCTHTYTHTYTPVHVYINEHTRRHIFIFTHTHTHTYIFTYTFTHACV